MNLEMIELAAYDDMKKYLFYMKKYSRGFKVNLKILSSIIYVEKMQYELDGITSILKKGKIELISFLSKNPLLFDVLIKKLKLSQGYTHVFYNTAEVAYNIISKNEEYRNILSDFDLKKYPNDPIYAIKISTIILNVLQNLWIREIDIRDNAAIMGTLYNIVDFQFLHLESVYPVPHKNPKSGGSVLPVIVDGQLYEGLCFGDRVEKVYNSKSMSAFII